MGNEPGWVSLKMHEALWRDVYKDTARIHQDFRDGIKAGTICRLRVKGHGSTRVAVRGLKDNEKSFLRVDEVTRERLRIDHLKPGESVEVKLKELWFFGRFCWAMKASDPASNVSIRIAVFSLVIGLIALFPILRLLGVLFQWLGGLLLWFDCPFR